jgi:cell wall-associated NlpC family hydrolase
LRNLIGIPFIDGGRDPKVGLDCWGMVMLAARYFGYEMPDYKMSCFDSLRIGVTAASEMQGRRWQKLECPVPGCVVAMAADPEMPEMVNHVGTYIGKGEFLQTTAKTGSIKTSIHDPYWKNKIKGYYKWNQIS